MGMSAFYDPFDDAESTATLHGALDLGVTFFDTHRQPGENVAAPDIPVTTRELGLLEQLAPVGVAAGERYAPEGMRTLNH